MSARRFTLKELADAILSTGTGEERSVLRIEVPDDSLTCPGCRAQVPLTEGPVALVLCCPNCGRCVG